ncbi:MAG TPA: F0F1 ATP synthase subunit gamma [Acidimicrobiales bacterium]|nr:F0F1 ATP synthase subunit gamma [Acidimicrobiales bacterium]
MAGSQERVLRRRIRSVASTQKITRAMELIAASRIVRAQQAIAAARPYVRKMREVVEHLSDTPDAATHPLFREVEAPQRVAIILITADRGLAGGYNVQIFRTVERLIREYRAAGREVQLLPFGKKGDNHFRRRNYPIITSITGISERPTYADARKAVSAVMGPFEAGELDQIELVYTRFASLGSQVVTVRQLIPLVRSEPEPARASDLGLAGQTVVGQGGPVLKTDYEYEPEPAEILDRLLPSWLVAEVLAALLESAASEQASRQRAMKAATDNADELIKNLRRVMNRARQDAITTEIMEIVGGAEALRQAGSDVGGGIHEIFDTAAQSA